MPSCVQEIQRRSRSIALFFLAVACLLGGVRGAHGQGNYEIQVYGSDTVLPTNLMVELHSNYTASGQTNVVDDVYPTNHQEHETLELTQGITDWSEIGFYVFTTEQDGHGVQWGGETIRPRVRAPDSWHLPVGLSLSTEIGYQRAVYSPDTWTWEIRPIIDKTAGRGYFAVNPALEPTLHAPVGNKGLEGMPAEWEASVRGMVYQAMRSSCILEVLQAERVTLIRCRIRDGLTMK